MCWALYLAADRALPHRAWDPAARGFNAHPPTAREAGVAAQFTWPHVLYLGSHTQCGCGFLAEDERDPAEAALRERTLHALADYLAAALAQRARLELFLCWEGDQGVEPVARRRLAPQAFAAWSFPLGERELAVVDG